MFFIYSCTNAPNFPAEPKIEFVSLSDTIIEQKDPNNFFSVTIGFEDGDGDLGISNPEISPCTNPCLPEGTANSCFENELFSIFIIDERTGCLLPSGQVIPVIPRRGSSSAISGNMTISVGPVCCFDRVGGLGGCVPLPDLPFDEINFRIKIRDRAGNFSNEITVGPVMIECN